jgi:hypothetical protein
MGPGWPSNSRPRICHCVGRHSVVRFLSVRWPGSFYYRGVRLSDGAGIELANAVRSSGGFDVTNPTDGTRYQVRPNGLTMVQPDGQVFSEPMVQYASS